MICWNWTILWFVHTSHCFVFAINRVSIFIRFKVEDPLWHRPIRNLLNYLPTPHPGETGAQWRKNKFEYFRFLRSLFEKWRELTRETLVTKYWRQNCCNDSLNRAEDVPALLFPAFLAATPPPCGRQASRKVSVDRIGVEKSLFLFCNIRNLWWHEIPVSFQINVKDQPYVSSAILTLNYLLANSWPISFSFCLHLLHFLMSLLNSSKRNYPVNY